MPITLVSLSDFLLQYDSALEWLKRHGVRIHGTRLSTYRRVIARAEEQEAQGRPDEQQRPELENAVIEASEIIEIAKLDGEHFADPEVLRKLKSISAGAVTMAEGFDRARDNALELQTAAVLQSQGQFGGFSQQNGDLTVTAERYPAECKRVSSIKRTRGRLREGRDQLIRLVVEGSPPGVVVIDLTRPIRMAHGRIVAKDDEQFEHEAEQRLTAYLPEHVMTEENMESLICASVVGVIVRCLSAGVAGETSNIRRVVSWQACSLHADYSTEDALFRRVAAAFGPGGLRRGTLKELKDAVARVEVVPARNRPRVPG